MNLQWKPHIHCWDCDSTACTNYIILAQATSISKAWPCRGSQADTPSCGSNAGCQHLKWLQSSGTCARYMRYAQPPPSAIGHIPAKEVRSLQAWVMQLLLTVWLGAACALINSVNAQGRKKRLSHINWTHQALQRPKLPIHVQDSSKAALAHIAACCWHSVNRKQLNFLQHSFWGIIHWVGCPWETDTPLNKIKSPLLGMYASHQQQFQLATEILRERLSRGIVSMAANLMLMLAGVPAVYCNCRPIHMQFSNNGAFPLKLRLPIFGGTRDPPQT